MPKTNKDIFLGIGGTAGIIFGLYNMFKVSDIIVATQKDVGFILLLDGSIFILVGLRVLGQAMRKE